MDRIDREEEVIIVSQDRTRFKILDLDILKKWYPGSYKTMRMCDIVDEDGYIKYIFESKEYKKFDLKNFNTLEKLRCAYSFFQYEIIFENGYEVSLSDDNIYFDSSNSVELLFVDDINLYDEENVSKEFFLQVKARILSMFSKYTFDEILKSNFTLKFKSKFENLILEAEDTEVLKEVVVKYIKEEEAKQDKNYIFVKKQGFILYRIFTYIFLVLFLCVSSFTVYSYVTSVQTLEFENELYVEFIDGNYSNVLEISKGEELSKEQKYIVGYASIMTSSLDSEKKDVILSTYTKNISESVMEYWIYIGHGDYKNAISKGKAVNNDEYVLYALRLEENRLYNNNSMDGNEKELELKSTREAIEEYEAKLGITSEEESSDE